MNSYVQQPEMDVLFIRTVTRISRKGKTKTKQIHQYIYTNFTTDTLKGNLTDTHVPQEKIQLDLPHLDGG